MTSSCADTAGSNSRAEQVLDALTRTVATKQHRHSNSLSPGIEHDEGSYALAAPLTGNHPGLAVLRNGKRSRARDHPNSSSTPPASPDLGISRPQVAEVGGHGLASSSGVDTHTPKRATGQSTGIKSLRFATPPPTVPGSSTAALLRQALTPLARDDSNDAQKAAASRTGRLADLALEQGVNTESKQQCTHRRADTARNGAHPLTLDVTHPAQPVGLAALPTLYPQGLSMGMQCMDAQASSAPPSPANSDSYEQGCALQLHAPTSRVRNRMRSSTGRKRADQGQDSAQPARPGPEVKQRKRQRVRVGTPPAAFKSALDSTSHELGSETLVPDAAGVASTHANLAAQPLPSDAWAGPGEDPRMSVWTPPASPYSLLEEVLWDNPWELLVACQLLNKTTAGQVRRVLGPLLAAFPTPEALACADTPQAQEALQALLRPLGLHRSRAARLVRFSREYVDKQWRDPRELHGVGQYGADAYALFCRGAWRQMRCPADKDLARYWTWLHATGGQGQGLARESRADVLRLHTTPT